MTDATLLLMIASRISLFKALAFTRGSIFCYVAFGKMMFSRAIRSTKSLSSATKRSIRQMSAFPFIADKVSIRCGLPVRILTLLRGR